ncbi:MAG: NUDIX domain-containing protein [Promethearchaeota archaeon]
MKALHYTAAGGVVVDIDRVLILRRPDRDEVRLPKGHVEKGESARETSLREVMEESGYADLGIIADLGHQTVEFDYKGKHVIRDERYFLMRLRSSRRIEREPQEHQFLPDWLTWDKALSELTFEAEREWVRRAREAYSRSRS